MMMEIEELYNKNRKQYVSMMAGILHGDHGAAEDVVQEAFTRAIKFVDSYDEDRGKLTTWFNRIMFNALRDVQKEMRGLSGHQVQDFSVEDVFLGGLLEDHAEFHQIVKEKISNVANYKHKRILELFFLRGYTSTEIAQIEKRVSVSNVTTVVGRFRNSLSKDLKWFVQAPILDRRN